MNSYCTRFLPILPMTEIEVIQNTQRITNSVVSGMDDELETHAKYVIIGVATSEEVSGITEKNIDISHSFTMRNISYSNEGQSGNTQDEPANAGLQSYETQSFVSDISSQNFAFHSTPSFTMSTLENITLMDESKQILQEAEQKAETIVIDMERKEYEGVELATPAQVSHIANKEKFMTKADASFFIDCMNGRRQGRIESKKFRDYKKVTTVNEVQSS